MRGTPLPQRHRGGLRRGGHLGLQLQPQGGGLLRREVPAGAPPAGRHMGHHDRGTQRGGGGGVRLLLRRRHQQVPRPMRDAAGACTKSDQLLSRDWSADYQQGKSVPVDDKNCLFCAGVVIRSVVSRKLKPQFCRRTAVAIKIVLASLAAAGLPCHGTMQR